MTVHKWCFSHSNSDLPDLQFNQLSEEDNVKTSVWRNSSSDTFCFKVHITENLVFTKRDVFSQIACVFDPLCLLGSVISKTKFFIQSLWLLKIDWHEKLPAAVVNEWSTFEQSFPALEKIKIPRFFFF
ncbi:uncharacterized protein NPIL_390381 [Nephila pilipes]|uniref:Uncharacterized protein n=1 Tax=Nephila pilipes TaxID=299642 RepID=A0A8X6NI38_NEPPI|nr:uncharacterized protein NPIL_390381 [Nephila pilipes]